MNWKYETNYTINVTVVNPLSRKQQVISISVRVTRPPKTTLTQVCPYFDFLQTNQIAIKLDTEDTLIYAANMPSSIINFTYPYYTAQCGVQNFNYLAILFDDPKSMIITDAFAPDTQTIYSQIDLNISNTSLVFNSSNQYSINVYLYYTDNAANQNFYSYNKELILQLSDKDSILVASFDQNYNSIYTGDTVILNGSSSQDTQNAKNKNFNYNWKCPTQLLNQTICSIAYRSSILTLTPADRNTLGINQPGQNYKFGLQVYDGVRTSDWVYSSVFIKPYSSNGQCLQVSLADSTITRTVDQNFIYPLFRELVLNQSCVGIQYTSLLNKITLVQSASNTASDYLISIQSGNFVRTARDLVRVPYNLMAAKDLMYYFSYSLSYQIGEDYQDTQSYLETITFKQYAAISPLPDQFYLQSNSVFNLATDTSFAFSIFAFEQTLNSTSNGLSFAWKCDSALSLSTLCGSNKNSTLTLKSSDRNFSQLINKTLSIQVTVNYQTYAAYFTVVSQGVIAIPKTCQVESNQISYVNVSQLLVLSLSCSQTDLQLLSQAGALFKWLISPFDSSTLLVNGRSDQQTLLIRPGSLTQNKVYFTNLTIALANSMVNISLPFQFSTSQYKVSQLLQTSTVIVTPKSGSFYQTQFLVLLGQNWGTTLSTFKLNLFYSVILILSDGTYFYWQPMTLVPKNLTLNLGDLPEFSKIIVEVINNYGQISSNTITGLTVTSNNNTNTSSLYQSKSLLMSSVNDDPIQQMRVVLQLLQIVNKTDYQVSLSQQKQDLEMLLQEIVSMKNYIATWINTAKGQL